MKFTILVMGKTDMSFVKDGVEIYIKRLKRYAPVEFVYLNEPKNQSKYTFEQQKQRDAEVFLKNIKDTDWVVLLDDKGKEYSSENFAKFIKSKMINARNVSFVIGGPYGFDKSLYARANETISLSKMTFSHQMIRVFFVEQIYRAMTILKGEPYHH